MLTLLSEPKTNHSLPVRQGRDSRDLCRANRARCRISIIAGTLAIVCLGVFGVTNVWRRNFGNSECTRNSQKFFFYSSMQTQCTTSSANKNNIGQCVHDSDKCTPMLRGLQARFDGRKTVQTNDGARRQRYVPTSLEVRIERQANIRMQKQHTNLRGMINPIIKLTGLLMHSHNHRLDDGPTRRDEAHNVPDATTTKSTNVAPAPERGSGTLMYPPQHNTDDLYNITATAEEL